MSATWLEIVWTTTGILGFAVCIWAHYDAVADWHWVQSRALDLDPADDDARRNQQAGELIARGNVRDEALRAVIQALFVIIGIAAMTSSSGNATRSGVVVAACLITAQLILVTKSLLGRRDRRRVIAIYRPMKWVRHV